MKVGTKELKNRLSYYLRRVRDGESVEVTDRGTVVAELRAAKKSPAKSEDEAIARMVAEGLLTMPTRKKRRDFAPFKPLKPVRLSKLIDEDRG